MTILFCGDVMPGGVLPYQKTYISSELQAHLDHFDFRVGTLEAAIGTGLAYDPIKMNGRANIIYARDEDFHRVKEMGFNIVSLANNHVMDLGIDGLKSTIKIIEDNGIQHCGAGMNSEEASRPAIIENEGYKIAVFAYCMYGNKWLGHVELAAKGQGGVNPLHMDHVIADIKEAKRKYDFVIVMPHWGREYRYEPLPECVQMAKQMIEAGADAVLGSHPHQIQPMIKYKKGYICFSMGNFLFPDFYMYPPRPIWYPDDSEDLSQIKEVVGYPFPIEEPIKQVWNPQSRYGCMIEMEIRNGQIGIDLNYVHLSSDNVLSLSPGTRRMKFQLWKIANKIQSPSFRFLIRCIRKCKRIIQ
jgi:poly-gamma-glutamate synthesis protein (capsule biosynthesis protein)